MITYKLSKNNSRKSFLIYILSYIEKIIHASQCGCSRIVAPSPSLSAYLYSFTHSTPHTCIYNILTPRTYTQRHIHTTHIHTCTYTQPTSGAEVSLEGIVLLCQLDHLCACV